MVMLLVQIAWYVGAAVAFGVLLLVFFDHQLALNTMDRGLAAMAIIRKMPGRLLRAYRYAPRHGTRFPVSRNWHLRSL